MPLDPRVLLLGLQPQEARAPFDAPDVIEERRARIALAREQRQKVTEDAQDKQQMQQTLLQSLAQTARRIGKGPS